MAIEIIGAASENQKKLLDAFAVFAELDGIEYKDLGVGENYILKKNGKTFVLKVRSNRVDGGFMSVKQ